MFQDLTSLVVDIGTAHTRIGYGGDDAPKLMPHSYVNLYGSAMQSESQSKFHVGDKHLYNARADHEIQSIFHRKGIEGYQYDYERLQAFLHTYLVDELGVKLNEYSVLLSQDVATKHQENKQHREKIAEFFLQKMNVANIFFLKAPVLSCFATGRSTALILDSGEHFTRSIAVHEGYCLLKSAQTVAYGGANLSKTIKEVLERKTGRPLVSKFGLRDDNFSTSFLNFHQKELLTDIKQSLSVRKQDESSNVVSNVIQYELPDKKTITIERKQIPQGLLVGDESIGFRGAASLAVDTVNNCDVDIKKQLFSNFLMTGGNMLYGTVIEDLLTKVNQSAPGNVKVKPVSVCWPYQRKYLSWIGGSIVTSLSSFQSYWIGNQQWKQTGPQILQKKCT